MKFKKYLMGPGGGEGSIIHYGYDVSGAFIHVATSRHIKFSAPQRSWTKSLSFLDDFHDGEEIQEILGDCCDDRILDFFIDALNGLKTLTRGE